MPRRTRLDGTGEPTEQVRPSPTRMAKRSGR
jgi:hypothetical protein